MNKLKKLEKFLLEAVCGFVMWTGILTPYMIFITKVTAEQYLFWLGMQAFIVPPASILVVNVTNKLVKDLL